MKTCSNEMCKHLYNNIWELCPRCLNGNTISLRDTMRAAAIHDIGLTEEEAEYLVEVVKAANKIIIDYGGQEVVFTGELRDYIEAALEAKLLMDRCQGGWRFS